MNTGLFSKFLNILNQLEKQKINYQIYHHRDEAVMITIAIVGERWEIEFLENGDIEVEKFISKGEIKGEETLWELFGWKTEDNEGVLPQMPENYRVDDERLTSLISENF